MQVHRRGTDSEELPISPVLDDEAPTAFKEEREALERVLHWPGISRSTNLVRFLSFICNKYFERRTDHIREYTIRVEASGRKEPNLDPQADLIIRVTRRSPSKQLREL